MEPVKILIIDKDILARQAIVHILHNTPYYKVAGVGRKIEDTIKEVSATDPDVILLNVEGDDSSTQSVLRDLRKQFPSLPVIALNTKSEAGARQAIEALRMGAVDFITKPEQSKNLLFARNHLRKRLIPIINTVVSSRAVKTSGHDNGDWLNRTQAFKQSALGGRRSPAVGRFDLVVVGGCTGGPEALFKLIPALPSDFPVPVVIAQHFPRFYTAELARRLNKRAALTVREAYNGARLKPGEIWIAPGGYHSEIRRQGNQRVIQVHRGPRENGQRPSINYLFRSASRVLGRNLLAVMLGSYSKDGLEGVKAVKAAGGRIMVQHPASAIAVEGLQAIIRNGFADSWHYTEELASQIVGAMQTGLSEAPSDVLLPLFESDLSEEV